MQSCLRWALVSRSTYLYIIINFLSEKKSVNKVKRFYLSASIEKIVISELCSRVFGLSRRTIRFAYRSEEYRRQDLIGRPIFSDWDAGGFIQRMQNNSRKYPWKGIWNNANSETKCRESATSFHFGRTWTWHGRWDHATRWRSSKIVTRVTNFLFVERYIILKLSATLDQLGNP